MNTAREDEGSKMVILHLITAKMQSKKDTNVEYSRI